MAMSHLSGRPLTQEEYEKLYDKTGGFLPDPNVNHPLLERRDGERYYADLKDGCALLAKNNPELFCVSDD